MSDAAADVPTVRQEFDAFAALARAQFMADAVAKEGISAAR